MREGNSTPCRELKRLFSYIDKLCSDESSSIRGSEFFLCWRSCGKCWRARKIAGDLPFARKFYTKMGIVAKEAGEGSGDEGGGEYKQSR